ncbi:hypothetical protein SteCoe_24797 [Stentor coeruleus]|uniref:Uncharacterized protein n=1 Tax=Stentor coeruleus TaxID=5963 RepID=A0A1R2BGP0_9CILI|nr:hypothetical protein SteCoe_24797 [Stentor coeruleus]
MSSQVFYEYSDEEHHEDGISNAPMRVHDNHRNTVSSSENGSIKQNSNPNSVQKELCKTIILESHNPSKVLTPRDTDIKKSFKKSNVENDGCSCTIL